MKKQQQWRKGNVAGCPKSTVSSKMELSPPRIVTGACACDDLTCYLLCCSLGLFCCSSPNSPFLMGLIFFMNLSSARGNVGFITRNCSGNELAFKP